MNSSTLITMATGAVSVTPWCLSPLLHQFLHSKLYSLFLWHHLKDRNINSRAREKCAPISKGLDSPPMMELRFQLPWQQTLHISLIVILITMRSWSLRGHCELDLLRAADGRHSERFFGADPVVEFLGWLDGLVVDVRDDVASFHSSSSEQKFCIKGGKQWTLFINSTRKGIGCQNVEYNFE